MEQDEIIKNIFPNSIPSMAITIDDSDGNSGSWIFPENNDNIIKQTYSINEEKYFIHYTSIDGLFGILNSCQLRLHNLFTLNDPFELKFALSNLGIKLTENDYYKYKQQMFVTSFCGYDLIKQNEDYNMWRFYGKNGYGTALVFEIENYNSEWNGYTFGKVKYGYKNAAIVKLIQVSEYCKRNKNIGTIISSLIPMMSMMHKHQVWEIENEYRLFASCSYNDVNFKENIPLANYFLRSTLNHYITDNGDKGAFTCLPFNTNVIKEEMTLRSKGHNIESYFEMFPHLKLKRVITGYNINELKSNQIIDFGSRLANAKLGYPVEFIGSKFKREFK